VKVPRTVEKRVPVTYTRRVPRTVVMRVPLDACGNPLPTPTTTPTAITAPPTSSRPTSGTAAPALAQEPAAGRTYSERQATAEEPAEEVQSGWKESDLDHVDPQTEDKPSAGEKQETLRPTPQEPSSPSAPASDEKSVVEPIPTPGSSSGTDTLESRVSESSRALPARGPAVEPAMPAFDRSPSRIDEPRLVPIVMPSQDLET
jgi:hypothetical protein